MGGIKLDDIKAAKFKPELAQRVRDERINAILRMFDQFGPGTFSLIFVFSFSSPSPSPPLLFLYLFFFCLLYIAVHKRKVFADEGHCFITFENKESVEKAMEVMKDAETRKKLAEAAKEAQQAHKMNPLCAPHPQFYVRIPKQKNKKGKGQKKEEESSSSRSSTPDLTGFTEVKTKKDWGGPGSAPAAGAPSSPSSAPSRPLRKPGNHPDDRSDSSSSSSGSAAAAPPAALGKPKLLKKKPIQPPRRIIKPPEDPELDNLDKFPTSKNVFCILDDEE